MPVVRRNPPRPPRGPRPARGVANAPYALSPFPWSPARPSILSIAHDEADGGALYVIMDRPVILLGSGANGLPLLVRTADGGPVEIVSAAQALPYKWRLTLTGAPGPRGAWQWPDGGGEFAPTPAANFVDPITNHPLNAAAGDCADVPGPFTPTIANVVSTSFGDSGSGTSWVEMTFDAPVLLRSPTLTPDVAVIFNGFYAGSSVTQSNLYALRFDVPYALSSGSSWFVQRQPGWVVTGVAAPQSGTF
jgi:hypothetical protein